MRLLVYSIHCPFPANNGAKMRSAALLRALAAEKHAVTLLAFAQRNEPFDQAPLRSLCDAYHFLPLELPALSSGAAWARRVRTFPSSIPFAIARFAVPGMRALLARTLESARFDALICDTPFGAANLPATELPLILHAHNVEHDLIRQYAHLARNPGIRAYATLEGARMRRWEQKIARQAAVILACSAADRGRFQRLAPGTPVVVAPNVICLSEYTAAPVGDDRTLIYQGGMDWMPNRDAVAFFAANILPLIRRRVPQARLLAAGRTPPPRFARRWRNAAGVEFTGTLPDLRAIVAQSAVSVVPLRIGGGTRLKILEAAALGRAIISTPLGAEGLCFTAGVDMEIAANPATFARLATDLLLDRQRRAALGAAARSWVERSYGLHQLRDALRHAFDLIGPTTVPAAITTAAAARAQGG